MEQDRKPSMQRVSLGDVEIEYSERGGGEPIVLVHAGVFGDWFLPVSESPALDGFRVIRIRRAGYGSTPPTRHLTIADHARHAGALADRLGVPKIHWVGHSSSCQMGLQLAIDRPDLVHSLVLLEPAAVGGFAVPATEELVRRFAGPAMEAFASGDIENAFDTFMSGVCGGEHRAVTEARLGGAGYERAVRDSAFFFRDELPAVLESRFGAAEGRRVRQPVLVVEGAASARLGPLSRQITELTTTLLPHTEVVTVPGVNHQMPLQDPDAVGRVIATFARQHAIPPSGGESRSRSDPA
ncbi:MAG: alpha/beta hydrolase [Pseudonocardiales bacterium]|nr:MAG: alpha/beta hydrolase [Pseudonocardiales bacterium]